MAKKNRGQRANDTTTTAQESSPATQPVETTGASEAVMGENDLVTLTKRNVQKNGIVTYARDGVNASVYFNKSMFNGEPPETVQVAASNLRAPGDASVGGGRTVDPAKLAERSAKATERAEKAKARAEKAAEKAAKLAARVAAAQPAAEATE